MFGGMTGGLLATEPGPGGQCRVCHDPDGVAVQVGSDDLQLATGGRAVEGQPSADAARPGDLRRTARSSMSSSRFRSASSSVAADGRDCGMTQTLGPLAKLIAKVSCRRQQLQTAVGQLAFDAETLRPPWGCLINCLTRDRLGHSA
jgi:hypothetical protein